MPYKYDPTEDPYSGIFAKAEKSMAKKKSTAKKYSKKSAKKKTPSTAAKKEKKPTPSMIRSTGDPIFLTVAQGLMEKVVLPYGLEVFEKQLRHYFAKCLAISTDGVSINSSMIELLQVTLDLTLDDPKEISPEEIESFLKFGIETKATTQLNRFTGMEIDEQS